MLKRIFCRKPKLSVIVIVYRMPNQALNTLTSLGVEYQTEVSEDDYEVIVVENRSGAVLDDQSIKACGRNFRYFLRDDAGVSPVDAVNFGAGKAKSSYLAIMIDGARMVTPRVISNALKIWNADSEAVVSVPGYHLGRELQQQAVISGYNEEVEEQLLKGIDWQNSGYRLFEISVFSASCAGGFFRPISETNFLGVSVERFRALGGCDPLFDLAGGGYVNLDLYKRCCESPGANLYLLIGEGTFHQFHGGVTTGQKLQDRGALMRQLREQYKEIRGQEFRPPQVEATIFGTIHPAVLPFIRDSS